MNYLHLTVLFCLTSVFAVEAQNMEKKAPLSYVVQDEEVDHVWDMWMAENNEMEEFRAWRILVVGVESRREIDREIRRFERTFPALPFDWAYDPPFYKLKTGIFQHRLEAKPLLNTIKKEFPGALEIRDNVEFETYFEEKGQ